MGLLTFDSAAGGIDELEALRQGQVPDQIEIGENDQAWLFVRRSTQSIEFLSKQTGALTKTCLLSQAQAHGVSAQQVAAAKAALRLVRGN